MFNFSDGQYMNRMEWGFFLDFLVVFVFFFCYFLTSPDSEDLFTSVQNITQPEFCFCLI